MCQRVGELRGAPQAVVAALDPDAVGPADVPGLWRSFDAIERLATAAKTLLARRVEDSRVWDPAGYRSAPEYLAATAGASVGQARRQLSTSTKLGAVPGTETALRAGQLSA